MYSCRSTVEWFFNCVVNFRGRKLSRISRFFSHPRKFSPRNATFLPIRESFLPRKFPAIQYYEQNSVHLYLIKLEPRQFQHQNGRQSSEPSLLIQFRRVRGGVQRVVEVGVALDLDRKRPKSRFVGEVLSVQNPLCLRVAIKELNYRISPAMETKSYF